MANRYLFTVFLQGIGNSSEEAWRDAVESTNLQDDPTPDEDEWLIIGEEEEE